MGYYYRSTRGLRVPRLAHYQARNASLRSLLRCMWVRRQGQVSGFSMAEGFGMYFRDCGFTFRQLREEISAAGFILESTSRRRLVQDGRLVRGRDSGSESRGHSEAPRRA